MTDIARASQLEADATPPARTDGSDSGSSNSDVNHINQGFQTHVVLDRLVIHIAAWIRKRKKM